MDYMREINAFYDWLETNPVSQHGILLWHALMHVNNKAGWIAEFGVAISVLSLKTGGVSRRTIERARNELAQKGRIKWKERPGSQSAVYSIIPIVRHTDAQPVVQSVAQPVVQSVAQPVVQPDAIIRLNVDVNENEHLTLTGDVSHAPALTDAPQKRKPAPKPQKSAYGEFGKVLLTADEYEKLGSVLGTKRQDMIDRLDSYIASCGKRYSSHYATLLTWWRRDNQQTGGEAHVGAGRQNTAYGHGNARQPSSGAAQTTDPIQQLKGFRIAGAND